MNEDMKIIEDVSPIKHVGFFIAMLVYQRVMVGRWNSPFNMVPVSGDVLTFSVGIDSQSGWRIRISY